MKLINKVLSFLLSLPVLFYRYSISPFLRPACRHAPSCSQFMLDALKIHGPFTGLLMGTGRILRCRPGGTHGYDPVPLFRFRRYMPFSEIFTRREKENRLKRWGPTLPLTSLPPQPHNRQPKCRIVNKVTRKSFPSFWRRGGRDAWLSDFYSVHFPAWVVDLFLVFFYLYMY